jgi:zinc protease
MTAIFAFQNSPFMKIKLVLGNGLLCLFLTICAFSQTGVAPFALTDKLPVDPAVRIGRLANGLTYFIQRNLKPEKKVQLRLVVNAGSVLEDPDQQGLAHFMEHMNFNGLEHFPKNELVSYLQSIGVQFGADLNAYTSFDETVFILPIPSDDSVKVDKGFTILEDWAGNALLDTTEINKERGVVLEESRLGKGALERMGKQFYPEIFNGSKYAQRLPIGKDDTIRYFQPQTLQRFYKNWYRPDLQAVVVVGDIDPDLAEREIISHFSHFKNPDPEIPRPAIIPMVTRTESKSMVLTDKEQTSTLLEIYNYVEPDQPILTWGDYRKSIVEGLFTAIINQRLNELTQQAEPPFVVANTGFGSLVRGYRAFTSFALLGDKPARQAIDALVTTTEAVQKFGFLPGELDRAKSNLLNQAQLANENRDKTESNRLVQAYVNHFLTGAPIPGVENRYKFIQQILPGISLEELNAFASKMQSNQGKFVMLLAPEKNAAQLPASSELLAMLNAAHQLPIKPYTEKAVVKSLLEKSPAPGKIVSESTNPALGTTDLSLSNGVTITLRPTDFRNDDIRMDAWRYGGIYKYPLADKENAQNATALVMTMGVKDLSPEDLRKFLSGKTANVTPYMNSYDEGIEGNSSKQDFETFLQLIYLYFTQPRKDETLFQSYISKQKGFLQNILANPRVYFADTLSRIEYGDNPWAREIPRPGDFDKIRLDRSFSIYKEVFDNAYGMHFTFVGDIDPAKVKPLLETYLGGLPSRPKENTFTDVGLRPVKGIVDATIKKGLEKQSLVNIIFTGEAPYSQLEGLKLKVLTDALNIKIIEQLREEMSGIYTGQIRGNVEKRPYAHYTVTLSFPCGPENVEKLTKAALDIIQHAIDSSVDQKDLDKVKETLKKQDQDHLKQNDHWLNELSGAWIERDDPSWILQYQGKLESLTLEDMQQTAKKYFNMHRYIKAVLLPEK